MAMQLWVGGDYLLIDNRALYYYPWSDLHCLTGQCKPLHSNRFSCM